ncbi:MAG: hypothetical protein AAGL49_11145, partial [Pseudomonadota bacterium]
MTPGRERRPDPLGRIRTGAAPLGRPETSAGPASTTSSTSDSAIPAPKPRAPRATAAGVGAAAHQASFWLFMGILAWAPLPLASNRAWAWSLLTLLTGAALALWGLSLALTGASAPATLARIRFPAAAIVLVCLWILIQWTPFLPAAAHDPHWAAAREAAGLATSGRITVNPYATLTGLMNLLTYCGAFWLAYQF